MTHTTKERLNTYKDNHNQFQPKRTDAEDWERTTKEALKAGNKKSKPREKR